MTARCVLVLLSPMNAMAAISAVRTLHPDGAVRCAAVIADWPGASEAEDAPRIATVETLLGAFPEVDRVLRIGEADASDMAAGTPADLTRRLAGSLGLPAVDGILAAHDAVGSVYQTLCAGFPSARRIVYGDGPGVVYRREDVLANYWREPDPLRQDRKRSLWCTRLANFRRFEHRTADADGAAPLTPGFVRDILFRPDAYCLSLPIDMYGAAGPDDTLVNVPVAVLRDVVARAARALDVDAHERRLLQAMGDGTKILLVAKDYTESGTMARDDETAFYADAVARAAPDGAAVLVKPHPAAKWSRADALRERLDGRYAILEMPPSVRNLPIELFANLAAACRVIGVSTASLGFLHLYGLAMERALDDGAIDRWVKPQHRERLRGYEAHFAAIAAKLATWDGTGWLVRQDPERLDPAAGRVPAVAVDDAARFDEGDHVSPGFRRVRPDACFPEMIRGDRAAVTWPFFRTGIPHTHYVDRRIPQVGFLNRDEAHILYNTALAFAGRRALEIGCFMGWSACHLALAGVRLDVVDPLLDNPQFHGSVTASLKAAGVLDRVRLFPGASPAKVEDVALADGEGWSLIFIDGDHEDPGPFRDAVACEPYAAADAAILFHDLAAPAVERGLRVLRDRGWNTKLYHTAQIMGVAWRGNVQPVVHHPDPRVRWSLPAHLDGYASDL